MWRLIEIMKTTKQETNLENYCYNNTDGFHKTTNNNNEVFKKPILDWLVSGSVSKLVCKVVIYNVSSQVTLLCNCINFNSISGRKEAYDHPKRGHGNPCKQNRLLTLVEIRSTRKV